MEKLITVSISAYNKEAYLDRCVQSLLVPSLDRVEIIIVNDGSTDSTSEIAHKYAERYPEAIKVVDKKNGHQGSCVNVALAMAVGKYFKMLDADDAFETGAFQRFVRMLEQCDADMIVSGHVIMGNPVRTICPQNVQFGYVYSLDEIDFREKGMTECIGMHGTAFCTSIFRENQIRFTEHCSFTDAEYCYYPIRYCKTVLFFNEILYLYHTGVPGQESSIVSRTVLDSIYKVTCGILTNFSEIREETNPIVWKNSSIVLERCVMVYLAMYLLHFRTDVSENKRVDGILCEVRDNLPVLYENLCSVTTRKISFVKIYTKYKVTSYFLYKLLNGVYSFLKRFR